MTPGCEDIPCKTITRKQTVAMCLIFTGCTLFFKRTAHWFHPVLLVTLSHLPKPQVMDLTLCAAKTVVRGFGMGDRSSFFHMALIEVIIGQKCFWVSPHSILHGWITIPDPTYTPLSTELSARSVKKIRMIFISCAKHPEKSVGQEIEQFNTVCPKSIQLCRAGYSKFQRK